MKTKPMNQKPEPPKQGELDIDVPKIRRPKRTQPEIIRDMALQWACGDRNMARDWIDRRIEECEQELERATKEYETKKETLIAIGRVQLAASLYPPKPNAAHKNAIEARSLV